MRLDYCQSHHPNDDSLQRSGRSCLLDTFRPTEERVPLEVRNAADQRPESPTLFVLRLSAPLPEQAGK